MARRVTASAAINGVDDETFGSNEFGHAEFTRETILDNGQPQNVMRMQCRWGRTVSNSQRVDNTDEGGDFATIDMTVNNAIVEV